MKLIGLVIAAFVAAAVPAVTLGQDKAVPAEQSVSAGFQAVKRHTIVPGDTLWSLAGRYYGDPYKWRRLHEANPDVIKDPHWIYPSGEILIPDVTEEIKPSVAAVPEPVPAAEPVKEEAAETAAEAAESASFEELEASSSTDVQPLLPPSVSAPVSPSQSAGIKIPDISDDMPEDVKGGYPSMVTVAVPVDWKEDGKVIPAKDEMEGSGMAVTGDKVRIEFKAEGILSPGDRITAYRRGNKLKDTKTGKSALELQKLAVLKVVNIGKRQAAAIILKMNSAVEPGDVVKKE